jgi:hypothetical protein
MKAKPFKATPVPNLGGKGPSDTMTRAEVVALVAARVEDRYDNVRSARTRISTNIYDDLKTGKLREVRPRVFRLGDVGAWARKKWPGGKFSDLPIFPIKGGATRTLPALRATGAGYTHAKTLPAAIAEILILRAENRALADALAAAEGRVRELAPDAQKFRNWNDKKKGKRSD